jgi:glycosyltransferase involved in cell wall biosynthesis
VVDDGSPAPVQPTRSDDLVLVRQPNAGPGGARNRGAEVARGELIALLDADDRWKPDKLARQVAFHDAHADFVLSCTDIVLTDGRAFRATRSLRAGGIGERIPFERLFYENCVCCSSVMMRAEAFRRTPGMVPHRRMGEDFGLWLRLGRLGPIGYVEGTLTERRQHGESLMSEQHRDGSWLAQERQIYREFLDENPSLRGEPFVRRALARLEFQGGWAHLTRGEWRDARRALARSLRHEPTRLRSWIDLARATLHVGPRRP